MIRQRDASLDLVRVVGVVAILVGHVWYSGTPQLATYSWHVPVFFVLAGYLWTPGRTVAGEWSRRVPTIVVPYIVWWVIVAVVFAVWSVARGDGLPVKPIAKAAWGGSLASEPFNTFWFFTALVVAGLFVRAVPRLVAWAGAVAAIVVCGVAPEFAIRVPLAALIGVGCAVFLLAGIEFKRLRPRIPAPLVTGLLLLVVSGVVVSSSAYDRLELKSAEFGTPVLSVVVAVAISVGLVLVAETVVPAIPGFPAATVTTLARCATFVMLSHGLILWARDTPPSGRWSDFALVLVVPFALALATLRTPLAPWLHGAKRSPRSA